MAHPNEDLTRRGYGAFATMDVATLNELFADDIAWHAPGRSQLSGDYYGKEAVFGVFGRTVELSGGTFSIELHDVLANDDHAVALVVSRGQREGRSLEDKQAHVFHIVDGQVKEFWLHPGDTYANDEFWG